jgi:dCTP deaminase
VIPGDELVQLLADPASGLVVTPIISAESQIGDASIDIRLGPDIIVSRRATGATAFDPSDASRFRDGLMRRQQYVRRGIGDPFHLQPGEFVIARSLEYVALPEDIGAQAVGRSSWGRLGLTIATATLVQPGFKGTITLELANVGNTAIVLEVGLSIAQLVFSRDRVELPTGSNCGQAKASRLTTAEETLSEERRQRAKDWWATRCRSRKPSRYEGQMKPALSRLDDDPDLLWVSPMSIRYVVGVVGDRFAGKSTVVSFLVSRRHFRLYRLSRIVYEEARRRGFDVANKHNLRSVGDALREQYGQDAIARLAFERIRADHLDPDRRKPAANIVIEGFKVPEELEAWQHLTMFRTLLVDTTARQRMRRMVAGGYLEDERGAVADPFPERDEVGQLDWFRRHVDEPDDDRHLAEPLIAQARGHASTIDVRNDAEGVPKVYDTLREEVVPTLDRWWRAQDI